MPRTPVIPDAGLVEGIAVTLGRDRDPLLASGLPTQYVDVDPDETSEWVESFDNVVDHAGNYRARYLMLSLLRRAAERNVGVPSLRSTDYINTIPPEREPDVPRKRGAREADPPDHPLERGDHGPSRAASGHLRRRPHLELRIVGDPVRSGLQPLLPRA